MVGKLEQVYILAKELHSRTGYSATADIVARLDEIWEELKHVKDGYDAAPSSALWETGFDALERVLDEAPSD